MDLEIIIPTEVSQTEKDKYHRASFICRILKKKKKGHKWTYLQNRNRPTDIKSKLVVAGAWEGWPGPLELEYTHTAVCAGDGQLWRAGWCRQLCSVPCDNLWWRRMYTKNICEYMCVCVCTFNIIIIFLWACVLNCFSCVQLFATPWTVACQAPLSMGFSRQKYWRGLPYPSPGDLPNPGIEPASLKYPALAEGSLPLAPPGKP